MRYASEGITVSVVCLLIVLVVAAILASLVCINAKLEAPPSATALIKDATPAHFHCILSGVKSGHIRGYLVGDRIVYSQNDFSNLCESL